MLDIDGIRWRRKCIEDSFKLKKSFYYQSLEQVKYKSEDLSPKETVVSLPKSKPTQLKKPKKTQVENSPQQREIVDIPESLESKPSKSKPSSDNPFVIEKPKGKPTQIKESKKESIKPIDKRTRLDPEGIVKTGIEGPKKSKYEKYEDKPTYFLRRGQGLEDEVLVVYDELGNYITNFIDEKQAYSLVDEYLNEDNQVLEALSNGNKFFEKYMSEYDIDSRENKFESLVRLRRLGYLLGSFPLGFKFTPKGLFKSGVLDKVVEGQGKQLLEAMKEGEDVWYGLYDWLVENRHPKEAELLSRTYEEENLENIKSLENPSNKKPKKESPFDFGKTSLTNSSKPEPSIHSSLKPKQPKTPEKSPFEKTKQDTSEQLKEKVEKKESKVPKQVVETTKIPSFVKQNIEVRRPYGIDRDVLKVEGNNENGYVITDMSGSRVESIGYPTERQASEVASKMVYRTLPIDEQRKITSDGILTMVGEGIRMDKIRRDLRNEGHQWPVAVSVNMVNDGLIELDRSKPTERPVGEPETYGYYRLTPKGKGKLAIDNAIREDDTARRLFTALESGEDVGFALKDRFEEIGNQDAVEGMKYVYDIGLSLDEIVEKIRKLEEDLISRDPDVGRRVLNEKIERLAKNSGFTVEELMKEYYGMRQADEGPYGRIV